MVSGRSGRAGVRHFRSRRTGRNLRHALRRMESQLPDRPQAGSQIMNVNEAVRIHLASVQAGHADFDDTLELINQYFEFRPTGFSNGPLRNETGENAGSCRVFGLGQYCNLSETDTL